MQGAARDSSRHLSRHHFWSRRPCHGAAPAASGGVPGGGVRHQRPRCRGRATTGRAGRFGRHAATFRDRPQAQRPHPAAPRGVVDHIRAHGGQRCPRKHHLVAGCGGRSGNAVRAARANYCLSRLAGCSSERLCRGPAADGHAGCRQGRRRPMDCRAAVRCRSRARRTPRPRAQQCGRARWTGPGRHGRRALRRAAARDLPRCAEPGDGRDRARLVRSGDDLAGGPGHGASAAVERRNHRPRAVGRRALRGRRARRRPADAHRPRDHRAAPGRRGAPAPGGAAADFDRDDDAHVRGAVVSRADGDYVAGDHLHGARCHRHRAARHPRERHRLRRRPRASAAAHRARACRIAAAGDRA